MNLKKTKNIARMNKGLSEFSLDQDIFGEIYGVSSQFNRARLRKNISIDSTTRTKI